MKEPEILTNLTTSPMVCFFDLPNNFFDEYQASI